MCFLGFSSPHAVDEIHHYADHQPATEARIRLPAQAPCTHAPCRTTPHSATFREPLCTDAPTLASFVEV